MLRRSTAPTRVLVIISTMVVALVLLLASSVQATEEAGDLAPVASYIVQPGDTLWDIAVQVTPPNHDVREVVETIRDVNRLAGTTIRPGQVLAVPATVAPTGAVTDLATDPAG